MAFLIFHIFSLHAVNNVGLESTNGIKKRILSRLAYEMDIVKKLPSAVGRCLKARGACSPEDKKEIEQGTKRIMAVIGILLITIPTIYTFHKKLKSGHKKLKSEQPVVSKSTGNVSAAEQKNIIAAFSTAVSKSRLEYLRRLFSHYTLSQGSLKDFLEVAVAFADAPTVRELISHMKNPSFTTKEGDPLFKLAIARRSGIFSDEAIREINQIVIALCENGANPNGRYKNGWTPLMHAARYDLPYVIITLIQFGANKKLKNNKGKTAYNLAVENNASEGVKQKVEFEL